MKSFLTVLKFEFLGLCKEKVYLFSTILMCIVLSLLLFAPRLVQLYDNFVGGATAQESTESYALYDPMDIIKEEAFQQAFPKGTLIKVTSLDELQQKVESSEVVVGYYVKSDTEYVSYVYNSSLFSSDNQVFEQLMIAQYRNKELTALGSDIGKINQILSTSPIGEQVILGKDGRYGYMVAYGMIMFIYILIILYGSMISTKVASEKSNRTMEILVTSSNPNALIFGKVIGVATAGLLQVGIVAFIAYISYQMNITYWSFLESAFAQLSLPIICVFLLFGIIGYLLYSFLFGALGALVDKVEDVNASVTPCMLIFIISFFITMTNLSNIDGMVIKIASFVPFSSCLAMLARIVSGHVMMWEIIISLLILILFTGFVGYIGAKIYRRGTLLYGNKGKVWKVLRMKE